MIDFFMGAHNFPRFTLWALLLAVLLAIGAALFDGAPPTNQMSEQNTTQHKERRITKIVKWLWTKE